jgi:DNA-binding NarL/FixJ family response regulator
LLISFSLAKRKSIPNNFIFLFKIKKKIIILAIKKINKGELVLSDCLKNSLLNKKNFEKILINKLSARESEVLVHLCAGKKNSEISDLLHINVKTTSTYKTRLFKKLEVTNLVSLVAKCKSLNII